MVFRLTTLAGYRRWDIAPGTSSWHDDEGAPHLPVVPPPFRAAFADAPPWYPTPHLKGGRERAKWGFNTAVRQPEASFEALCAETQSSGTRPLA
jgi:hypothetical protein